MTQAPGAPPWPHVALTVHLQGHRVGVWFGAIREWAGDHGLGLHAPCFALLFPPGPKWEQGCLGAEESRQVCTHTSGGLQGPHSRLLGHLGGSQQGSAAGASCGGAHWGGCHTQPAPLHMLSSAESPSQGLRTGRPGPPALPLTQTFRQESEGDRSRGGVGSQEASSWPACPGRLQLPSC